MTIINEYLSLTKQYKEEYSDKTLLLMQVGSFFECYAIVDKDNKYIGSNIQDFSDINDLVISYKNCLHENKKIVMAGFGVAQLEKYIKKMQEHNYTIVIYTQDENTKNTTRSLSCIYSPGTYFSNDSTSLSNICICIWLHHSKSNKHFTETLTIGMSSIDIYTGKSNTMEYTTNYIKSSTMFDTLENYLAINNPSECLLVSNYSEPYVNELINCKVHLFSYSHLWIQNISKQKYQYEIIQMFLNKEPSTIFSEWNISTQSYTLLIQFIYKHNPNLIKKLEEPTLINSETKLILANHSLKQLNIINDCTQNNVKNSCLINILNNCITNMGKRQFNYELLNPSIDFNHLESIYTITEYIIQQNLWKQIRSDLNGIKDLSKIYRKIILGKLSPKDFYTIYNNLCIINKIYLYIYNDQTLYNYIAFPNIPFNISEIQLYITHNLNLEACKKYDDLSFDKFCLNNIYDTMLFNSNYSNDLKTAFNNFYKCYTQIIDIKNFLDLSIKEYEINNGLSSSKRKENLDYIKLHECPKSEPALVGTTKRLNILKKIMNNITCNYFNPQNIEIKTHNGSNSMIISNEINSITKNILKYKEIFLKKLIIEFNHYASNFINTYETHLTNIINYITKCDIIQNKCYIADTFNFSKPIIINQPTSTIECTGLRHPIIEKINHKETYIANDINFNSIKSGYLLYGTNAVGKTSFIKSLGIAIIMAQAGLFVPAKLFKYSIYKSIYTRILGNDNIFKGLSTFAVEMTELRSILKNANENSLILGDELCSGTESTSALSIFTAGVSYLSQKKCSFIFATHFHEIINYSEITNIDTLELLHMSVIYNMKEDKLIYDRKIKKGPGENMYGLEVCKSLNLPQDFLDLAHQIRYKYNNINTNGLIIESKECHYNKSKLKGLCEICKINQGDEIHHLIYQKNFKNSNLTNINHPANLINICIKCHDMLHANDLQLKIYKTSNGYEIL